MKAPKLLLKAAVSAIIICLSGACTQKTSESSEYFIGTNFWYGPILAAPEGTPGSDRARLSAELDSLKAIGITNLRVLVGADGPEGSEVKVRPSLQTAPGVYNRDILEGISYFLSQLEKRGMKAVLYLNNAWEWSGGYGSYLEWAGRGVTPDTRTAGYGAYMDFVKDFITDTEAQELYFKHLRYIVGRFAKSNAIYSWQIANEPRCFSDSAEVQRLFTAFLWKSAAAIKSADPRHKVSTGSEGMWGCQGSMELYELIHSCPDIDYLTIHIWPYNWSWAAESSLCEDLQAAIDSTDSYIDRHLELAAKLGKDVVIEEFGYPRDGFSFQAGSPTGARDSYYGHLFSRVEASQMEGGRLLGLNFWGWGGLASQTPGHIYWADGDDYCGDPAQEQQGLNSVYMCDSSTVELIRSSTGRLRNNVRIHVPLAHDWLFSSDAKAVLNAEVSSQAGVDIPLQAVLVRDRSLMSERKDTVAVSRAVAGTALDNHASVAFDFGRLEPGFYQVNISGTAADGSRVDAKPFNIGCSPELIDSPKDAQPDFDSFWESTLAELAEVPTDYRMELMEDRCDASRNVYRVYIKSLGGVEIGGILAMPVAEGRYPAYIEYMGYGADVYPYWGGDKPEAIQFLVSVRDQGIFRDRNGVKQERWIDRGLACREDFYYRGAFCDAVRAVDFVASLDRTDPELIFGMGESQGGALTWIAASLDHRFRAIAPAVPFLSDYRDYHDIVYWPMWEVMETADKEGLDRDELYRMLSYFDVKNFTDRIDCPVKMAFGLQDPVCPPHTNFAGYNMVRSEKTYMCVPLCGHGMWEVKEWAAEREAFFHSFIDGNSTIPTK